MCLSIGNIYGTKINNSYISVFFLMLSGETLIDAELQMLLFQHNIRLKKKQN